jgi:dipeptidyl-peptidase-4
MAISIAPVTNWRYYDSIYTEIYNGLPQNNPDGYDQNSPINFADKLKGKLLIVHGSADDNVHLQNAMEMIRELIRAGKQFDMMIYPDKNHSILGGARHHLMKRCINYVKDNL